MPAPKCLHGNPWKDCRQCHVAEFQVTAETITDEQITVMRKNLLKESGNQLTCDTDACGQAMINPSEPRFVNCKNVATAVRQISREHCAQLYNVRNGR